MGDSVTELTDRSAIKDDYKLCLDELEGRRIPSVYMLGAAKAGTSYLAWSMSHHSRICLGRKKEPEFFSFRERYEAGFPWYTGLYQKATEDQILLDASTGYSRFPEYPDVAKRIHRYAPEAKLIYIMRDPIKRAYSHYIHRWSKELHFNEPFTVPFEEHIENDPVCLNSSDYQMQIQQYLDHFPRSSMLFLFTDDLKKSPETVARRVCDFLELPFQSAILDGPPEDKANDSSEYLKSRMKVSLAGRIKAVPGLALATKVIPSGVKDAGFEMLRRSVLGKSAVEAFTPPPMKPETRGRLIQRFRASNEWVANLTGADLSGWNA